MTIPQRPRDHPIRVLDGYELALLGLDAHQERARPVVEALQAQHPELTAELLGDMLACDAAHLIELVRRLKDALEREP